MIGAPKTPLQLLLSLKKYIQAMESINKEQQKTALQGSVTSMAYLSGIEDAFFKVRLILDDHIADYITKNEET